MKMRVSHAGLRVHPRIRGEYMDKIIYSDKGLGSPPHTRGILCDFP